MPADRSDLPNAGKAAVGAAKCATRGIGSEGLRSTEASSTFSLEAGEAHRHRLSGSSVSCRKIHKSRHPRRGAH
jgi:hypothetical protein